MTKTELTAVVAGAGSIGTRHTSNLLELGVQVSVTDPNDKARETITNEQDVLTYSSLSSALDSEIPDFVVVAAPNRFHVDLAIEAAKTGCHLFVEKPLSDSMERIEVLEEVISTEDIVTLVGCNLRFLPEIRKIRSLVQQKAIGEIIAARIEGGSYLPEWFPDSDYRDSYSARSDLGGGVILDYIHEINYARWLFGPFREVSSMAEQKTHLEIETNDVASILAETERGVLCEFHLDYIQRPSSRSCHLIGESGTIRWSWADEKVKCHRVNEEEPETFSRPEKWAINDMYLDEMTHFLDCIVNHTETTCSIMCGKQDLAVALAARESAKTGRHILLNEYN